MISIMVDPRITGIVTPSPKTLTRALDMKYGRTEKIPLPGLYVDDAKALLEFQRSHSFPFFSDGQALWGDLLRPVYKDINSVEVGSQTRWFETNGFCFPPKVVAAPKVNFPSLNPVLYHHLIPGTMEVTLAGPYTLTRMAENQVHLSDDALMDVFTEAIANMIRILPLNVQLVELAEPALSYDSKNNPPGDRTDARARYTKMVGQAYVAYRRLVAAGRGRTIMMQLPHVAAAHVAHIVSYFPVHGFGLDLTETVTFDNKINLDGKILSAGILDAGSSVPEDTDFAPRRVMDAVRAWNPGRVFVTTNAQLFQSISYAPAMKKLEEMVAVAAKVRQQL